MVAVVGAGAIGGYLAAMLWNSGHTVTLCVRTAFEALTIEMGGVTRDIPVKITNNPENVGQSDWIVLATKAQDSESAKPWLDRLVGPRSIVLVTQNGVEQVARHTPLVKGATILPSVVYIAAERTEPGHVIHHGTSQLIVPAGPSGAAAAGLFDGSALQVIEADDFTTVAWRKLLANVAVNPLTALTMRRMDVFSEKPIVELAHALLSETVMVGRAEGAKLSRADVDDALSMCANSNPHGGSSMLYDRISGHSLEHDHLTGAVLRAANRHEINTPLNRAFFALLDALDRSNTRLGRD